MEQIKVSKLASEFEMNPSVVISELKIIGVWVPSADTPVDHDIADRIRRRLQLILDLELQDKEKAKEQKEKKLPPLTRTKKTIKQLGTTPRRAKKQIVKPDPPTILTKSMKPRKGTGIYRRVALVEEEVLQKIEVTIDDEPIIEKVEAQLSAEALDQALRSLTAAEKKTPKVTAPVLPSVGKKPTLEASSTTKVPPEVPEISGIVAKPPTKVPVSQPKSKPPTRIAPPEVVRPTLQVAPDQVAEKPKQPPEELEREVASTPELPVDQKAQPPAPETVTEIREVTFSEKITVKELGEKVGIKSTEIIKDLFNRGIIATINQTLEQNVVEEICELRGVLPSFVSFEEAVVEQEVTQERPEDLENRPPVVTVMGHVDHGKTSLLDAIRETRVAAGESGGITQHIGAYHVDVKGQRIVFIDTPGHEAFTRMRARGAQATDVVVLVVAADDGVMPQTTEAVDHARAAGVPILVCINKIDLPGAQPDRVKQALSDLELISEEWGGDTVMVEVSAKEKKNLDHLLEMILLSTEILELKANSNRTATGVVLEARLDKGKGVVASVLVRNGTLHGGDSFIAGAAYGKVRALFDDRGNAVTEATPSSAVEILGLQSLPQAGDTFQVVDNTARAREIGEFRQEQLREHELTRSSKVSLDELYDQMQTGTVKELRIVLKADTQGSLEVLTDTLGTLGTEKVRIKTVHSAVGAISESDVLLASASNAVVVGFNIRPEKSAQEAAEHEKVDVRLHRVIYDVANEIREAMTGLLEPTFREKNLGRAEVREVFRVPKFGTIAGSSVAEGVIRRNVDARLLRDNVVIYEGKVDSLRRFKEDINEVKAGYECGISIANFNDVKVGDVIEAYMQEEVAPELD